MYSRAKYKEGVDWSSLDNPAGTIKYDGAHYYMEIQEDGTPKFISRRPSVTGQWLDRSPKVPHLLTKMPHLAGNVYNVELIHTGKSKDNLESHANVSGILNSLPPKAIETQNTTGPIRAVLLDVVKPALETYDKKISHLAEVETSFNNPDLMFRVNPVEGKQAINDLIRSTRREGREGVIVTSSTKPESDNYRVKIKHKTTYNLLVVGVTQEFDKNGNSKDSAGALILADATGKIVGAAGTGLTDELRKQIWLSPKLWIGKKVVQVEAMDPTAEKLWHTVYKGEADGDIDVV